MSVPLDESKDIDFANAERELLLASPLILIVEDNEDNRTLFRCMLELHGCQVTEAEDGSEAVRLACLNHPDLILMDTELPLLDGLTATRQIRASQELHDIPIIFISGHDRPEEKARALALGGNDYFVKPVVLSELECAVDHALRRSHDVRSRSY